MGMICRSKKRKNKRESEPLDEKTRRVIENAILLRSRMKVRDLAGKAADFRANIAEDQEAARKEDGT